MPVNICTTLNNSSTGESTMSLVLFNGLDASTNRGLWVTDGTAAGTHELTGIVGADNGGNGINPAFIVAFNSQALFAGQDANGVVGLWVTDGTAAGTHELTGIAGAYFTGLNPFGLTVFNGKVLFQGRDTGDKAGLWVTDGTAAGTHVLSINGQNAGGLQPRFLTVLNNEVLFNGIDGTVRNNLWVTDGTAAGTHELTGITGASANGLNPLNLTVFGNEVLFNGADTNGFPTLWVTDGTVAGTHELTGIVRTGMTLILTSWRSSATRCCSMASTQTGTLTSG